MRIKGIRYLFVVLGMGVILSSCSEYSKLLKSEDTDLKYKAGLEYYKDSKFDKALPLFDNALAVWKGQDKAEEVYFYYCYTQYGLGNLPAASFNFKNFTESYFTSKHLEECAFMRAQCEYEMAMPVELDQSNTKFAIQELQLFMNLHPNSKYVDSCNNLMDELRQKLIKKDFKAAMLYYNIERYKSAISAFNNLRKDFPDVRNGDEVDFYIIKSHQKLAEQSIPDKRIERWDATSERCTAFLSQYKEGNEYFKKVNNIKIIAEKRLKQLNLK